MHEETGEIFLIPRSLEETKKASTLQIVLVALKIKNLKLYFIAITKTRKGNNSNHVLCTIIASGSLLPHCQSGLTKTTDHL